MLCYKDRTYCGSETHKEDCNKENAFCFIDHNHFNYLILIDQSSNFGSNFFISVFVFLKI